MAITKNLIFDLGNVLYDIDFLKMYGAFEALGIPHFENHFTLNKSDPLFFDLEKGLVNEYEFCNQIFFHSPQTNPHQYLYLYNS